MPKTFNRVKTFVSGTPGTGAVTLGTAATRFQTWSAGGAASGDWVNYLIEDGTDWELGSGLYNGTTITREGPTTDPWFMSSTGSLLNASSGATIASVEFSPGPPRIRQKAGARVGDSGTSTTLALSAGARAGNLLIIAYCGWTNTRTLPSGFTLLETSAANNQGTQINAKRAAGGETTFSVSISGDHGQFIVYEVDGADGVGSNAAQQYASGATTWSRDSYAQQPNLLRFGMFEVDTGTVPTVTTSGVTTDYSGTPTGGGNHAGVFFHIPKTHFGPVGGACDNTNVVFLDYWAAGGSNG